VVGLAPCTFSAPDTHDLLQGPHIPFLSGENAGQSKILDHVPLNWLGNQSFCSSSEKKPTNAKNLVAIVTLTDDCAMTFGVKPKPPKPSWTVLLEHCHC
jgi:hypothetical protein